MLSVLQLFNKSIIMIIRDTETRGSRKVVGIIHDLFCNYFRCRSQTTRLR